MKKGKLLASIPLSELCFREEHLKPCWKCKTTMARLQIDKAEISQSIGQLPKFFIVCAECGELAREQGD